jgi:hypothetical protein
VIKHVPGASERGVRLAPDVVHDVSPPWGILPDGGTLAITSSVIAGQVSTQEKHHCPPPLFHFATLFRIDTGQIGTEPEQYRLQSKT